MKRVRVRADWWARLEGWLRWWSATPWVLLRTGTTPCFCSCLSAMAVWCLALWYLTVNNCYSWDCCIHAVLFIFIFFNFLFLAALDLLAACGLSLIVGSRVSSALVHGLLIAVTSLIADLGL